MIEAAEIVIVSDIPQTPREPRKIQVFFFFLFVFCPTDADLTFFFKIKKCVDALPVLCHYSSLKSTPTTC